MDYVDPQTLPHEKNRFGLEGAADRREGGLRLLHNFRVLEFGLIFPNVIDFRPRGPRPMSKTWPVRRKSMRRIKSTCIRAVEILFP